MATIRSFTESLGVLGQNPILFAVGALYAAIVLPQTALSTFGIPLLPALFQIVTFFITPFVIAGLIGMSYESRARDTSFETFKRVGKDRYVSLLIGNLLEFGFTLVFGFVSLIVAFLVGFGAIAAGSASGASGAMLGGIGLVVFAILAVMFLVFLIVMLLIQFYPASIVVDQVGAVDGYRNSIGVVRNNLVQALGFSLLNLVIGILLFVPTIVLFLLPALQGELASGSTMGATASQTSMFGTSLLSMAGVIVYTLLVTALVTPFRMAFLVSFYDNHTDG